MKTKLIDLLGLTNMANDIRDWVNAHFQRKVDGKGLSTNDYDGTAKAKVDAIPADPKYTDTVYDDTALAGRVSTIEGKESGWDAKQDALVSGTNIKTVNGESLLGSGNIEIQGGGGEENVIEAITMNGASVPVTNKTAAITETDPTVPSWAKQSNKPSYNYSEIGNTPDLSGFITKSVNDLTNYYLKSETYTKAEVAALIGAIQQFHYEIYPTLPQSGESNVLYLIGPTGSGADKYEEYVYSNSAFNKIGDTSIDLSGYVTTSALNTTLANYVTTQFFAAALNNIPSYGVEYNQLGDSTKPISFISDGDIYAVGEQNADGNEDYILPTTIYVDNAVSTKYTKPQGGIPASDLASGVIPTVPVQDVTVGGTSVVNNGTAVIPQEVFLATYGTTTYSQISTAVSSGKIVACLYSDRLYVLSVLNSTRARFAAYWDKSAYLIQVTNADVWSNEINSLQSAYDRVSSITGYETDTSRYPSTKAVADYAQTIANKVSTISGNETNTTKYPNTKAVADALGKWGVISQTQTWSGTGTQQRTYVMSDLVYGTIPQANIDLFESAGATFNATTGYFEINGLTDISYEEMQKIYNKSIDNLSIRSDRQYQYYAVKDLRTLLPFYFNTYNGIQANWNAILAGSTKIETISSAAVVKFVNTSSTMFRDCSYLKSILFILNFANKTSSDSLLFRNCVSLENVLIQNLKISIDLKESHLLSKESILYMINNVDTSATGIVVTLHSMVYSKCTTGGDWYNDVNSALSNHTNITLASA